MDKRIFIMEDSQTILKALKDEGANQMNVGLSTLFSGKGTDT